MGMDISPLKNLLDTFLALATSYDQARSSFADKILELEKSEPYLKAKEDLALVLDEKSKKLRNYMLLSIPQGGKKESERVKGLSRCCQERS